MPERGQGKEAGASRPVGSLDKREDRHEHRAGPALDEDRAGGARGQLLKQARGEQDPRDTDLAGAAAGRDREERGGKPEQRDGA